MGSAAPAPRRLLGAEQKDPYHGEVPTAAPAKATAPRAAPAPAAAVTVVARPSTDPDWRNSPVAAPLLEAVVALGSSFQLAKRVPQMSPAQARSWQQPLRMGSGGVGSGLCKMQISSLVLRGEVLLCTFRAQINWSALLWLSELVMLMKMG